MFVSGLNHIENLLILTSVVTKCVSTSTFDSLVGIPVGMVSFAVGLKTCAITKELKCITLPSAILLVCWRLMNMH